MSGIEVVVGGTTSPTDQIMSGMMLIAFRQRGATVIDRSNTGDDALNRDDLVAGRLSVVPEDLSTGWFIHLGEETRFDRTNEMAEALRAGDQGNGIAWTDYSGFDDAVAPVARDDLGLSDDDAVPTMQRLAALLETHFDARVCVDTGTLQSPGGLVRFETATGFTVPAEQLDVLGEGEPLRGLLDGNCDVAFATTVEPELINADVAIVDRLDDGPAPRLVFDPRNTAFMFDEDLYAQEGEWLQPFIEALMVTLDRKTMSALKAELAGGSLATDIARSHLESAGLVMP